jgi:ParB family chromosome partitioning protein
LANLAASIRQVGVLQPLLVRPTAEGNYELVVGERRWRAARRAGLATVPALVVDTDDRGALERALVENIHRRDLNAIEEAAAYQQLIDEAGLTHEQLAERVGLSRPAITNAMRLLDLPDGVQRMVIDGLISAGHARALLGLESEGLIQRAAEKVAAEGLSVRDTEKLVREQKIGGEAEPEGAARAPRPTPAGLLEVEQRLSDLLATRVSIAMGRRKGKVVIEFASVDDLERIFGLITGPTSLVETTSTEGM